MVVLRSRVNPDDAESVKNHVLNEVIAAFHHGETEYCLEYQNIEVQTADAIFDVIDKRFEGHTTRACYDSLEKTLSFIIMPSFLHDSHQAWVNRSIYKAISQQVLTLEEYTTMKVSSGTRFSGFLPPYQKSKKEPDLSITLTGMMFPTVVFETGYSQSRASLTKVRDLWLRGARGSVQVAIIMKWIKSRSGVVKGDLEVFGLNAQGSIESLQKEIIFPAPPNAATQKILLTKAQLFGPMLTANQSATDTMVLALDDLRTIAIEDMTKQGLRPA